MSFGIALSGGGARGAAHAGVLLALEEEGLIPHSIAGTSAGSLIAGLYAAGLSPREIVEAVRQISVNPGRFLDADLLGMLRSVQQLASKHPLSLTGIIRGGRMERYLYEKTGGKNMREMRLRTVIPAVDINSGATVAFTNSLDGLAPVDGVRWETDALVSEAMRASSAYPAVFQPKMIGDLCLVDGGVTDVLPVDLLAAAGEKNVLAVDVGQNYEPPGQLNLFEISTHALSIMEIRLKDCRAHGERLTLVPELPKDAGLLTLEQMPQCVEAGYQAARTHMSFIRTLFG